MVCPKCAEPVDCKNDLFTVCEGICSKPFHAACVGLSEASIDCLMLKNVIWLCDHCLESIYKHITDQYMQCSPVKSPVLPSVEESEPPKTNPEPTEELIAIKRDIDSIKKTLAVISESHKSFQCAPRHSTPIISPKSNEGSRGNDRSNSHSANDNSCFSAASTRNDNDRTFSLFLTNIDAHVNEADIRTMVSRSLGVQETDEIDVKKLVPKWKATETLDYISFKVRMNDTFKPTALRADTWPTGITYREFIERPRITWKPSC